MRSTLLLLVVAVALAAYAYFVESDRPTRAEIETAKDRVFDLAASDLVELSVTGSSGERTDLRRANGVWRLVGPIQAEADAIEVSGITSGLESLEIERVVSDAPNDLSPFGLAEPRIVVAFATEAQAEPIELRLGGRTATGGDMYATTSADPRVFLVAAYLDGSFDRTAFDLRDKSILAFTRDDVDRLDIETPDYAIALAQQNGEWRLERPWTARADAGAIDSLVTRLETARMQTLVASEIDPGPKALSAYGLEDPDVHVRVGAGSTTATLVIGAPADADTVYARDAARPLVFTVEQSLVDEILREPDTYRRKQLFAFRSFNATRVEVEQRAGSRLVLEKSDDEPPAWRRLAPAPGDLEPADVTAALSKLSGLRTDGFTADPVPELETPIAIVTARYAADDENEAEDRVAFARSGDTVYARIGDDPGAGIVSAESFDEALADLAGLAGTGAPP